MSLGTQQLGPQDTRPHDLVPPSQYAELPVDELLAVRAGLREHEEQLSYWRRVVQGRLDLLDARLLGGAPSLTEVLGGEGQHATRTAHTTVRHVAPMLELATTDRAWSLASGSDDATVVRHAAARLRVAERWLSEQRMRVLADLDDATAVLLSRLADDPGAYLSSAQARWIASAG